MVQKVNHKHIWDVSEKDTSIACVREVSNGSDEEAYQDDESHNLNWFVEQDDGYEFQRSNGLVDPEVVNDNVTILKNVNDDDSIYDDIEEDDETVDDYCNEGENWFISDRERKSD